MKIYILSGVLIFAAGILSGGDLVPLKQYHKVERRVDPIPDKHLFSAAVSLAMLDLSENDIETILNNFSKLPMYNQYHIVYLLLNSENDNRITSYLIPAYKHVRNCVEGEDPYDNIEEKFQQIVHHFMDTVDHDPDVTGQLYKMAYAQAIRTSIYASPNEQLYIAEMLAFASDKRLKYAEVDEKDDIINFLIETINRTPSNNVKTILTERFIALFNRDQLEKLDTTEFALYSVLPELLARGNFSDFANVYYELAREKVDDSSNNELMEYLHKYFPAEKWNSPQEAFSFISNNPDAFEFDEENQTYRRK